MIDRKSRLTMNVAWMLSTAFVCCFQLGCGGKGEFPLAKVSGTIQTENRKPLPSGIISFRPVKVNEQGNTGKAAFSEIKDGKFVLTTYYPGDGAIVGLHKVALIESPVDEDFIDENSPIPQKHNCTISPDFRELEVVSGKSNVFEIVAVPISKKRRLSRDDEND